MLNVVLDQNTSVDATEMTSDLICVPSWNFKFDIVWNLPKIISRFLLSSKMTSFSDIHFYILNCFFSHFVGFLF